MTVTVKRPPSFPATGDRVAHQQYGVGTVTDLNVYHTVIDFDAHGLRRFITNRVVVERTSDPGPTPAERRATDLRRQREDRARIRAEAKADGSVEPKPKTKAKSPK